MRSFRFVILMGVLSLSVAACRPPSNTSQTLAQARAGFTTNLSELRSQCGPVEIPPPSVLRVVKYDAPVGKLSAYLSPKPSDGRKHPAIIWIVGGDCNTIGDVWTPQPSSNDQTAVAFRQAGIITMYPSLRGGNDSPGYQEGFYGEVNDVLAAADYLAKQPYVDPNRIYLGGHSTGGTLALLTSEFSDRFRAVFAMGPVGNAAVYGKEFLPIDLSSAREVKLRSPKYWLHGIKRPTYVMEGADQPSNIDSLRVLQRRSTNPQVHVLPIPGADHFTECLPITRVIADKILADTGTDVNISFTEEELSYR